MQEIVNIQDQISTEEENAELTQMFVKGKFFFFKNTILTHIYL